MTLREEFENSGNWLFRWRSYLPVLGIPIVILTLMNYHCLGHSKTIDHLLEIVCLATSFLGLAIRIYTIGYTPRGTSGRNTKNQVAETLNTTGAYSLVRNPLYLGNFFMGLGVVLFAHLWWLVLIYTLIFWLYYERIIFSEEAFLLDKFGDTYRAWAKMTPVFIPRFDSYLRTPLPFSMKNVLRREYNGFFAVICILFVFEVFGDFMTDGKLEVDTGWAILLSIGFTVWFTLRTLKTRTRLLHVDGR